MLLQPQALPYLIDLVILSKASGKIFHTGGKAEELLYQILTVESLGTMGQGVLSTKSFCILLEREREAVLYDFYCGIVILAHMNNEQKLSIT